MAEKSGGSTGLAFIVGALVVVVAVLGWLVLGGGIPGDDGSADIEVVLNTSSDG